MWSIQRRASAASEVYTGEAVDLDKGVDVDFDVDVDIDVSNQENSMCAGASDASLVVRVNLDSLMSQSELK